ncbi:macro domain-containing protein [Pseudobutyrivibrio sp.]|uniref:macro domain-containing protein n=1 Tax=Pseudobutyrivibrio sp. TaxID=2014367 RepID=UPI001B58BF4B|nr:macro domain-containing protein [Pseudobutyrivibrio sp.]MBP3261225.1 macro domain-containing protein [Pseudobutyrivibrio sp.]
MPFQIIRNDITKVKADAIVNTANPEVAIGDGVDSAIYKAAGKDKLLAERQKIGRLEPGEVAITPAFDMDASYIIHASGPWWQGGDKGEAKLLRQCYDKSLKLAAEHKCQSIAFPLLATGTYGFPQKLGIEIAVEAFTRFLEEYEMEIYLVVFGKKSVKISGELGEEVHSFIDDDYVSLALSDEYYYDGIPADLDESEDLDELIEISEGEPQIRGSEKGIKPSLSAPMMAGALASEAISKKVGSLDDVLKGIYKDSFEKHLQKIINKKGFKNSEVYAAANISKQYFSKLLKGQVKPSKEKVLALAVGLQLNMDETIDFLKLAGYAFSPISQTDAVVEYFIEHEEYNVMKIDIVLFDYGLDPLSNG